MKDIKGYEEHYAITSCGRVWSYKRKKFLRPQDNGSGYLQVALFKDGKCKRLLVHRLVADAYIPNTNNLPEVNHKDEVKEHNWVSNLEWCDHNYNINYGTGHERSSKAQTNDPKRSHRIRCVETGEIFPSLMECSRSMGINPGGISMVLSGKCKSSKGYHFEYVDLVEKECNTDITAVREMLRCSCRYYLNQDILNVVSSSNCGRVYNYNDRAYNLHNCEYVCDLYEALFGIRPMAIKCSDGRYVIYPNHYRADVRQKTIELCRQILQEV